MSARIPSMPYLDFVLGELEAENAVVREAWSKHLHFGYWESPESADLSLPGYARATDELTRRHFLAAEVAPRQRIVDVGCGLGGTIALLDEKFDELNLLGVNIDERQLAHARAHVTPRATARNRIQFLLADACALPFEDQSVDVVFSVECIFHFSSRQRYFREVKRVLKPGGRLIVSEFVARAWALPLLALLYVPFHSAVRGTYGDSAPPVTRGAYRRLGRDSGFELLGIQDVTPNTLPNYAILPKLAREFEESKTFQRGVKFLEYATRLGFYSYDILSFRSHG